jgi:Right handed beta helix region
MMRKCTLVTVGVLMVLLICLGADAAVYTVGINGTYATIQEAINAAVAAGGDNHIKLRASTFDEDPFIPSGMTSGSLSFTGGWSIFFNSRNPDPASTVINDSSSIYPTFTIEHAGGIVRFDGITFIGNNSLGGHTGGALKVSISQTAQLYFDHCVVTESSSAGPGAGGSISLEDTSHFEMSDCVISDNLSLNAAGSSAGGLRIYMLHSSTAKISWSTIENNAIVGAGTSSARGAGIVLEMGGATEFEAVDCVFSNNTLGSASGDKEGSEIFLNLSEYAGSPTVVLRRNRFESASSIDSLDMVHVYINGDLTTEISDSWISGGAGAGISAEMWNSGRLIINNTTVTEVLGTSVHIEADGTQDLMSVTNDIFWNNGTDTPSLHATTITSGNLIGVDPLFVSPGEKNYRLQAGSPAIDISTGTPAGGFSAVDLHSLDRMVGSAVDAGGSEWGGIFGDGFEMGSARMWTQ